MNKESIFRQLELRLAGCSLTADALSGFSAMAIADSLRQKRSIISHHLNNLHREQRVVKVNSRPVLFLPVEALRRHHRLAVRQGITRPFRRCARSGRTVWSCSLARRAACRSPCVSVRRRSVIPARACLCCCAARRGQEKVFGAPALAVRHRAGHFAPEAPFTVFNCAEYANNPELLTSKLFGHAKGAFTGADRAVSGLIETSNGGVLFIDEVHRLPPEGQEKLFHFMDNGTGVA